ILLDVGYSDVFLKNAEALNIDLSQVTDIVLSHGHNDHTGGLRAFLNAFSQPVCLWAHPDVFLPKRKDGLDIGSPMQQEELPDGVELHLTAEPAFVSPHACYLGQIPRHYPFEGCRPIGEVSKNGSFEPDFLFDDSGLVLSVDGGIFLLSGCAHSGIANMARQAKALCPGRELQGILGGFHLFELDTVSLNTMDALSELGVQKLYPCHCTALPVKAALMERFPVEEVAVSLSLNFSSGPNFAKC
ncbi:MAG: MBL fold metallo-hydrolase, partial [Firmicutes bacterium]|nr:MBL fold metallo-hydrolase [Bacillota bacterium]